MHTVPNDPKTILITNLPLDLKQETISTFFGFCGFIESIKITKTASSCSATVTFVDVHGADASLSLNGSYIGDYCVNVLSSPRQLTPSQNHYQESLIQFIADGVIVVDGVDQKFKVSPVIEKVVGLLLDFDKTYGISDKTCAVAAYFKVKERFNRVLETKTGEYAVSRVDEAKSMLIGLVDQVKTIVEEKKRATSPLLEEEEDIKVA